MAIMEHSYYASFGYHVTNFYAPSSRYGNPDELKELIDVAHGLGLYVLMDIVHSHASSNHVSTPISLRLCEWIDLLLLNRMMESPTWMALTISTSMVVHEAIISSGTGKHFCQFSPYPLQIPPLCHIALAASCSTTVNGKSFVSFSGIFVTGSKSFTWACHPFGWLFHWQVPIFQFDGYRFDGITSMLYTHHGIGTGFSGGYHEYFGDQVDSDAVTYLMLVIQKVLSHSLIHRFIWLCFFFSGKWLDQRTPSLWTVHCWRLSNSWMGPFQN